MPAKAPRKLQASLSGEVPKHCLFIEFQSRLLSSTVTLINNTCFAYMFYSHQQTTLRALLVLRLGNKTRRHHVGFCTTSLQTADVALGQPRAMQESLIHTHLHALENKCKHILPGQHAAPSSACSVRLSLSESWWGH